MTDRYKVGEILFLKEPYFINEDGSIDYKFDNKTGHKKWENKLFMPEKYARHYIRIIDKRQEYLQDITTEECLKEGIEPYSMVVDSSLRLISTAYLNHIDGELYFHARDAFAALIDEIDGKGTWDKNPIVTRYEFELIK